MHPNICKQIDNFTQAAFVELGTGKVFRKNIFQTLILLLNRPHRIVDDRSNFRRVCMDGNSFPTGFRRDIENRIITTLLIFITQILILVFLKALSFGNKLLIFSFEFVRDVFQENKSQYNGFIFRCINISAHLIRRLPYFLFKADVGCIHRCHCIEYFR